MQLPNISYYLSTGYSYLSAGYSRCSAFHQKEMEFYTSIFNSALKYAGVKEPFFTPFRTKLVVYPISITVGTIIGLALAKFIFFRESKQDRPTTDKKPTPSESIQPPKPVNPTAQSPISEPKAESVPNGKGEEKKKKKVNFHDTNTEVIELSRKWLALKKTDKNDDNLLRRIDRSLLESSLPEMESKNPFFELAELLEEYREKVLGQKRTDDS